MIKTIFAFFLLFIAACTTTADIQRECAAISANFSAEIACIENRVAQEPSLRDDSFAQEYVLAGRVLAEKVTLGQMTENEARLALSREYNNLVLRQQQYRAYNAIELDAIRPRHISCYQSGAYVYCDSY